MDELVRRTSAALAESAHPGALNGRIRDVPDRRVIRWYTTIGLVDRPVAMRGRTALYHHRHLLQLVAIKRRQAQGHALADIQAELAGATDDTLRRIVDGGENGAASTAPPDPSPRTSARFWAAPPTVDDVGVPPPPPESARTLTAIELPGGATLLLPGRPDGPDIRAIHAAARPLLDLLAGHGLLDLEERRPS